MSTKICQVVLVGHHGQKLILSADKEVFAKLIFISEKEHSPGSKRASEVLTSLLSEYASRKVVVENRNFSFHIPTKPIAELTHLIYQQKLQGFDEIVVNISGGIRYMDIWMYIAACITQSRIIHGDFIYEEEVEVGIHKNDTLDLIDMGYLTSKQVEFLELFFPSFSRPSELFAPQMLYEDNPLLNNFKTYESIEEVRTALIQQRGEILTRGSINGFIDKLNRISALKLSADVQNKKNISISYIGIAFFLKEMYNQLPENSI
ncbi:MAG: hypothetical protein EU533_08355 [Promethearchaeota archaeon]|nr:MAG: hypothetical protein EU533_08355 [Candidatus Lokiarchaeota archaeon]